MIMRIILSVVFSLSALASTAPYGLHAPLDDATLCAAVANLPHERFAMKNRPTPTSTVKATDVTVADMIAWPVPHVVGWKAKPDLQLLPYEAAVYRLTGYVRLAKVSQDDGDIHVQMADSPTKDPAPQVIIEVPCSQPKARQQLIDALGFAPSGSAKRLKGAAAVKIAVTGYGFFDLSHQTAVPSRQGHAHGTKDVQTLAELHPAYLVDTVK